MFSFKMRFCRFLVQLMIFYWNLDPLCTTRHCVLLGCRSTFILLWSYHLEISLLLNCPFPSPLAKENRYYWEGYWLLEYVKEKENPGNSAQCYSLSPRMPSQSSLHPWLYFSFFLCLFYKYININVYAIYVNIHFYVRYVYVYNSIRLYTVYSNM